MTPDDECWGQLKGFPNYTISNYGEVYNIKLRRSLENYVDRRGQHRVELMGLYGRSTFLVHVLVAKLFHPEYMPGAVFIHMDGDLRNNYVGNLRLKSDIPGKRALLSRVGDGGRKVMIVETGQVFRNVTDCAQFLRGDPSAIYRVLNGVYSSHRGYTFEYV